MKNIYQCKAVRLSEQLQEDIEDGLFKANSVLRTEDLVARYQVSRPTVRRALRILTENKRLVRQSQRGLRVPESAGQNNQFIPPAVAQKLTLGIVWAGTWAGESSYAHTQRLQGIKRYTELHGLALRSYLARTLDEVLEILDRIDQYPVDGIIVTPFLEDQHLRILRNLANQGYPLVSTSRIGDLALSSVMSDDKVGAYQATHYLIEKYARPVYYICHAPHEEIAADRHQGYNEAMRDAGFEEELDRCQYHLEISDANSDYWSMDRNWLAGGRAAEKLFKEVDRPISVLCMNDFVARGVYKAAHNHGLTIGKDVNVVGTDDLPLARLLKPALTTVRPRHEELGYEEARILHQLIEKKIQPPVHVHLPVELVVRESA